MSRRTLLVALAGLLLLAATGPARAADGDKFITVASTTSTEQSGLFGYLLPLFTTKTGITVRVVAQGTGQALKTGANGDADVVFVHDPAAEEKFVADGWGVERRQVMYNDFIIVGPASDPASVKGLTDAALVMLRISQHHIPFASRGDNSGTHSAELALWKQAGIDVKAASGGWYRELGQGMGPTLNTAAAMEAYTLTDRGTWLNFKNRGPLVIFVEGDPRLFNQYHVMLVNPTRHPTVKADLGRTFIAWLVSPEGQRAIAGYQIDGKRLFFPNAKPGE